MSSEQMSGRNKITLACATIIVSILPSKVLRRISPPKLLCYIITRPWPNLLQSSYSDNLGRMEREFCVSTEMLYRHGRLNGKFIAVYHVFMLLVRLLMDTYLSGKMHGSGSLPFNCPLEVSVCTFCGSNHVKKQMAELEHVLVSKQGILV